MPVLRDAHEDGQEVMMNGEEREAEQDVLQLVLREREIQETGYHRQRDAEASG